VTCHVPIRSRQAVDRALACASVRRRQPPMVGAAGGRSWWAHLAFTRINIAPTILRKKIEDLREADPRLINTSAPIQELARLMIHAKTISTWLASSRHHQFGVT
jgi:hypothetical protein